MLLALQLVVGRSEVWLPERFRRLELAGERQQRFIERLMRLIRRLERISRPRARFLFRGRASNVVFGLLVLAGSLGAFLAPPFTGLDTLPVARRGAALARGDPRRRAGGDRRRRGRGRRGGARDRAGQRRRARRQQPLCSARPPAVDGADPAYPGGGGGRVDVALDRGRRDPVFVHLQRGALRGGPPVGVVDQQPRAVHGGDVGDVAHRPGRARVRRPHGERADGGRVPSRALPAAASSHCDALPLTIPARSGRRPERVPGALADRVRVGGEADPLLVTAFRPRAESGSRAARRRSRGRSRRLPRSAAGRVRRDSATRPSGSPRGRLPGRPTAPCCRRPS